MQRLGNGQRIDHLVRALWAQALDDGQGFGDPLAPAPAADAFVAWMREPAEHGGDGGVNRYLYAAYLTRPDLQREFADLDGADGHPVGRLGLATRTPRGAVRTPAHHRRGGSGGHRVLRWPST